MNSSFALQGCLIFFGALLVRRLFPRGSTATAALVGIALSGTGVLLVGLAPEDVHPGLHALGAILHFFCGNAGMLVLGLTMLQRHSTSHFLAAGQSKWAGIATLLAGTIGLAGTLFFFHGQAFGLGTGGIERVAAYPLPIWLSGIGALLVLRGGFSEGAGVKVE